MIVNIRGTNGSGKTTLVRKLLGPDAREVVLDCGVKATEGRDGIVAIGPYCGAQCGGCDRVKTQADIKAAVLEAAGKYRHVLFEGVVVSTISAPWIEFSRSLRAAFGYGVVFAFMQTPVSECVARVFARNGGKRFDEALVVDKYLSINRAKKKIAHSGETVISSEDISL